VRQLPHFPGSLVPLNKVEFTVKQYVDENDPKNSIRKYQVHLLFDIREMPLAPFLNGSFTLRA
jgi:hypothetical protein